MQSTTPLFDGLLKKESFLRGAHKFTPKSSPHFHEVRK
jgi:hypothetical protein